MTVRIELIKTKAGNTYAELEMTNMVMINDEHTGNVLVQDRIKSWKGLAFPGGHVEDNESIYDSAVCEVKEETGLNVYNLKSCGIIHWLNNKTFDRYLVFLFKTTDYSGELISECDEGRNLWISKYVRKFYCKRRLKMSISISYLQEYIKANDYRPELKDRYFMKLAEEVGELSRAMRKNLRPASDGEIKGTIDEELWDVIYYAFALANCYDIDLEKVIPMKEKLNNAKYDDTVKFEAR